MTLAPEAERPRLASPRSSPFVGAAAFGEDDAPFFFGRTDETATVSAKLRSSRLTVLYGPSGVGRSSLLLSGVVAHLRDETLQPPDEPRCAVGVVSAWHEPGRAVREASRTALQELAGEEPLPPAGPTLVEALREWTARAGTLLLVLDQFEQYLLHHPDRNADELTGFGAELALIVRDRTLPVHVVMSIREEAWSGLDRFDRRIPARLVNYVRLDRLDADAAREAVEGPVFAWNRTLAPGEGPYYVDGALVDALLGSGDDGPFATAAGDGVEPMLLQLVLERLWRATVAAKARVLSLATLDSLGLERILESYVVGMLDRLQPRERKIAAAAFRFLATSAQTNAAHSAADLAEWARRPEAQVQAVLDKLCSAEGGRILRTVPVDHESTRYELFHGSFTQPISGWRDRHDAARRTETQQRLTRLGAIVLVLGILFAGVTAWALVDRNDASRHFQAEQSSNRQLEARILRLTAAQRAARRAAAAQAVVARKLTRQNTGIRATSAQLEQTRTRLDGEIASLRAENGNLVVAIRRFNSWNAALATKITDLDKAYAGTSSELADVQAQAGLLKNASATLTVELALATSEVTTLTAQNGQLAHKAGALGLPSSQPSSTPAPTTPKAKPPNTTTAPTFSVAADVPGADALRAQVGRLEQQLGALFTERARPSDTVRWLRKESALLVQRRDALLKEDEALQTTKAALESRRSELDQTRKQAAAEHATLARDAASRQSRNAQRTKQIAALQSGNVQLQSKAAKQIAALAAAQRKAAALATANKTLVDSIEPHVASLSSAAADASADPQLAGLLALEAYRLTPYDPDDPAHPAVYNALWLSLKRLDQKAAEKLIAPVDNPSGKVGTTRSSVLAKALCARIQRGLTPDEWNRYLGGGASYSAAAARPCP